MCGFAGFMTQDSFDSSAAKSQLTKMCDAITHRGPDDYGYWTDPTKKIAFGHRRLSILDLSEMGSQPMRSHSNRWVIIFNGEIYNHLDLRSELADQNRSPDWRGHSDTETLLAAFDAWGIDKTLSLCVGMFAMAIWDLKNLELTLVRDRFGEKPLYYGWVGDCEKKSLVFGSDLNALKQFNNFDPTIDRNSLSQYIRYGYVGDDRSIYKGIKKLLPANKIIISSKNLTSKTDCYWSANDIFTKKTSSNKHLDYKDAVGQIHSMLNESVRGQMLADVPIGSFLSGGIDSSLITALMQENSHSRVNTFSIGFQETEFNEAGFAKAVATHLGTEHTELYLSSNEVRETIPEMATIYSEPFADSSQIPTFLVSKLARQQVTVALSGDAGDEVFCGYNRYKIAHDFWPKLVFLPEKLRQIVGLAMLSIKPSLWDSLSSFTNQSRLGEKMHKFAQVIGSKNIESLYRDICSEWHDPESFVLGAKELIDPRFSDFSSEEMSNAEYMMACDFISYLPGDILVKVDRASMANSLETRAPFLNHHLVEFAWELPIEFKFRNGLTKAPLREILSSYIPKHLIDRPKMGFSIPIGEWLRGDLRDWAEELLSRERLSREGYFNPDPIRAIWLEHLSGRYNHEKKLWNVLMFQSWLAGQDL